MLTNFIRTTEESWNYYQGLNNITWKQMICFPCKGNRPLGKNEWVQLTEACTHQKVLVKTRQTKRKTTVTEVGIWFEEGFD